MNRLLKWLRRPARSRRAPALCSVGQELEHLGGTTFGQARGGPRPSFRPAVEALERREVPATLSSVSWAVGDLSHQRLYAIGQNHAVFFNEGGTQWTNLGGYVTAVSAGRVNNSPVVFAIGADHAVWVNSTYYAPQSWRSLGGYVTQISTFDDRVFAIGGDRAVWTNDFTGKGWTSLGGSVTQISASLVSRNRVYAIGANHATYVNDTNGTGWRSLGGYVTQISAGTNGHGGEAVYGIGANHAAYVNDANGTGWRSLGGYVTQISADDYGRVFAIGGDSAMWVNDHDGHGWSSWGGYVRQIAAGRIRQGGGYVHAVGGDYAAYRNTGFGGWSYLGGSVWNG